MTCLRRAQEKSGWGGKLRVMRGLPDGRIVILSGAGLSAASGVPTFRDADGLWEGHRVEEVATPQAWFADRSLVRSFYDERRLSCSKVRPNPGHGALVRLQEALGRDRVFLVTQNIDGLLTTAGAEDSLEMHGSLWRLKCEASDMHPRVEVQGKQDPQVSCVVCGALLRPDVVWFGEIPYALDEIDEAFGPAPCSSAWGRPGLFTPRPALLRGLRRPGRGAWRSIQGQRVAPLMR